MVRWLVVGAVVVMAVPLALILFVVASPAMSLAEPDRSGGPSVLALTGFLPTCKKVMLKASSSRVMTIAGLTWFVIVQRRTGAALEAVPQEVPTDAGERPAVPG